MTHATTRSLRTRLLATMLGGLALIGGAAAWYAGRTKVIGVEPERSRALHAALEAKSAWDPRPDWR